MKEKGTCPKCLSGDILTNAHRPKQGHRAVIGISIFSTMRVATYVCMQCGLIEEYMDDSAMKNQSKMDKLRTSWQKP